MKHTRHDRSRQAGQIGGGIPSGRYYKPALKRGHTLCTLVLPATRRVDTESSRTRRWRVVLPGENCQGETLKVWTQMAQIYMQRGIIIISSLYAAMSVIASRRNAQFQACVAQMPPRVAASCPIMGRTKKSNACCSFKRHGDDFINLLDEK